MYADNVLSQSAREGARLAAVEASWIGSTDVSCGKPGGPVCPANTAVLKAHVTAAVNRMVSGVGTIGAVYVSCDAAGSQPIGNWTAETACTSSTGAPGNLVSVHVRYTFGAITPIVGQIIGGTVQRDAFATMTIN